MKASLKAQLKQQLDTSGLSEVCTFCIHLHEKNVVARRCDAFPQGIPLEIWNGENDHTTAYPGDGGIRFEKFKLHKAA